MDDTQQGGFTRGGTIVDDLIVSLQSFEGANNTSNTLMRGFGHKLDLRHGGFENTNYKPNYNSVLNNPSRPNSGTDQRRRRPIRFNATDEARAGNATNARWRSIGSASRKKMRHAM
jgi:hypothetical protein